MARTTPLQPTAGLMTNNTHTDSWVNAIKELQAITQVLQGTTATANTPTTTGAGYVSWVAMGNMVVPLWASTATITWTLVGYQLAAATTTNTNVRPTVNGTLTGAATRLQGSGTTQSCTHALTDQITVSSVAGSTVPLALYAAFIAGTATAYQVTTTNSFYSALIIYT